MSFYCMSDVHGMQNAFHQMLNKIHFGENDQLYIIGDVIDRGPDGIGILREIMENSRMHMILGNHEYMMLEALLTRKTETEISRWARNGNATTLNGWNALSEPEKGRVFDYLQSLPDYLELEAGGKKFYMVHGFPGENTHDRVWGRPQGLDVESPIADKQLIIGHTPVPFLLCKTEQEEMEYFTKLEKEKSLNHILRTPGYWDIDCSCGHSDPGGALSCLRLDDLKEFYVPGRRSDPSVK